MYSMRLRINWQTHRTSPKLIGRKIFVPDNQSFKLLSDHGWQLQPGFMDDKSQQRWLFTLFSCISLKRDWWKGWNKMYLSTRTQEMKVKHLCLMIGLWGIISVENWPNEGRWLDETPPELSGSKEFWGSLGIGMRGRWEDEGCARVNLEGKQPNRRVLKNGSDWLVRSLFVLLSSNTT